MIPRDPAFEARVRESFAHQSHMATLGVTIERIARGDRFLACARVLRPNRTLTVCPVDVYATGAELTLIATMLSTVIVRPLRSA